MAVLPDILKPAAPQCAAEWPWQFSLQDWRQITVRVLREIGRDNVGVVAAGVAFFSLLAIFPLLTACLSIYGYFADPAQVQDLLLSVSGVMPGDAWVLLNDQITSVVQQPDAKLGVGIAAGLLIALYSAGSGIRAIMRAMNIAYGEVETRGFAKFYALAASMTLSLIIFLWTALAVIIGVPALLKVLSLDGTAALVTKVMPWVLLMGLFAFALGYSLPFWAKPPPRKKTLDLPRHYFYFCGVAHIIGGIFIFCCKFWNLQCDLRQPWRRHCAACLVLVDGICDYNRSRA